MPSKSDIAPMIVSLVRGFLIAAITVVLVAGGFNEVDWSAAGWAGFIAVLNVIIGYLGTFDTRYGRGSTDA